MKLKLLLEKVLNKVSCPKPAKDIKLNTKNRNKAVKDKLIQYGPLNVDKPGNFWKQIAKFWKTDVDAVQSSLCGNCGAFDVSPRMKECMPGELSDKDGELGYCWMHDFKCHSARTCRTWVKGGPIKYDDISYNWQSKKED